MPTSETLRYSNVMQSLISNNKNVIIMGDSGSGKTINIINFL